MRNFVFRLTWVAALLAAASPVWAQSSGVGGGSFLIVSLAVIVGLTMILVYLQSSADVKAREVKGGNGASVVKLKKGFDILLKGEAAPEVREATDARTFAIQPGNFAGVSPIPKLFVEAGQEVKAGDPLFFDKGQPDVKYASPVSGEVVAINRGAKRAIAEIVILADKEIKYREIPAFDYEKSSREELVRFLMEYGAWPHIRQRPFNVLADVGDTPVNIFISTFDTAPLAPDLNLAVEGRGEAFQAGLNVLNRLTSGKVYLGLDARSGKTPSNVFTQAANVEKRWFNGKHPAGNVGVQIHHVAPIGANDKVWTLGVQDVITLGALFSERRYNASRIVALTGAELNQPHYVRTYLGAKFDELIKGNLKQDHVRFISGDILSGEGKSADSYLNFHDDQVTVAKEGDYYEPFGWITPSRMRPTVSKTFFNFLAPSRRFEADTNTHGEKRAFVVTGQYDELLPMDIYPQHLMKAIITNDYEQIEGLGIYELVEEDVALCEFACTSKQPLQQILRQGLDLMHEQA